MSNTSAFDQQLLSQYFFTKKLQIREIREIREKLREALSYEEGSK